MPKQTEFQDVIQRRAPDLDEAIDELVAAREEHKRTTARVKTAEAVLTQRMLNLKTGRYDRTVAGKKYGAEIGLSEPEVKLKFLGEEDT